MLLPELSARPDIVNRFFNEARAVTSISDPRIVQVRLQLPQRRQRVHRHAVPRRRAAGPPADAARQAPDGRDDAAGRELARDRASSRSTVVGELRAEVTAGDITRAQFDRYDAELVACLQ